MRVINGKVCNFAEGWYSCSQFTFSGGEVQAQATIPHISSPTILKTLNGSQGIGVILAEKLQSAVSIMEALSKPIYLCYSKILSKKRAMRIFVVL